jgi:HK97 family phage portal protein
MRARYARSTGNMLQGGSGYTDWDGGYAGPGIDPGGVPPVIWWYGYDSGGGRYPVGPNGPHSVDIIPAVTRLTAVIVDPLASVPWKVVEQGFGGEVLYTPRWLTDPQLLRPDSRYPTQVLPSVLRQPRTEVFGTWIRSAVLFGCGFLAFIEDADGQPTAGSIRTLHPYMVEPVRDDNGTLVWEIGGSDSSDRVRADRDGYITIGNLRWRIVVLRDPHSPIDEEGHSVSVFERHADTFGTASTIDQFTRGSFANDGVPSGFLKVNTPGLQQEQANELKASWMAAHGGSRRSVAILNATTDYTPLSRSALDTALIENKRANLADLCMAFSLDPNGALGISMGNSATYANVSQYFSRLKLDLMPWIETVEQVVSALLPAGQGIRLDFSELTRGDPKEHYAALQIAVAAGILTIDEARNTLGLPSLPEPEPAPVPPQLQVVPEPEPEPEEPETTRSRPPALRR